MRYKPIDSERSYLDRAKDMRATAALLRDARARATLIKAAETYEKLAQAGADRDHADSSAMNPATAKQRSAA